MINALLISTLTLVHSGAQAANIAIKDDVVGTGPVVKAGDIVRVDYVGTLADGTEFDNSTGKPPFMFMVGAGQVIKGWDQGVAGMHEGGKRELTVPPTLGYGGKAVGSIPANSTLKFTVTVDKIEPKVQVEILVKGAGPEAKFGDIAHVQFMGGVKGQKPLFDTHDNQPKGPVAILIGESSLPIGFLPTLLGMQEGEKRKVTIPSDLAYGKSGIPAKDTNNVKAGSIVPPDSAMEFTFELVKIEKRAAPQQ